MQYRSPSEIAARAAALDVPEGRRAGIAGRCVACGTEHGPKDHMIDFDPPVSFTDFPALRARESRLVCRWCHAVWSSEFTTRYLRTVVCAAGVFRAASNDHLAYWLMNPPSGEWLFLQGDAKRQHVVWRTPVNTSRDIYRVQAGDTSLVIRRPRLLEATEAWGRLVEAINEANPKKKRKSPFLYLSRERDAVGQGQLHPELVGIAAASPDVAADMRLMNRLTSGERWALTAVIYAKAPAMPDPETVPLPVAA